MVLGPIAHTMFLAGLSKIFLPNHALKCEQTMNEERTIKAQWFETSEEWSNQWLKQDTIMGKRHSRVALRDGTVMEQSQWLALHSRHTTPRNSWSTTRVSIRPSGFCTKNTSTSDSETTHNSEMVNT